MVTYTIFMKELSATTSWQDITHAVAENKIPIRKGFGSLSEAIDMGSVSLSIHMESLEAAALLHTSQKQVLIQKDEVTIFEGISYNDADVEMQMNTDVVYASLKFKPYSSQFEKAIVPEDTVYTDVKICDPTDTSNSLVHILFSLMINNLPGDLPSLLSSVTSSTAISNTKTLSIVLLEKGKKIQEYLTDVLYQNGYAYYMDLFSIVVIEPYKDARVVDQIVDIRNLVEDPSISQEPYIIEKKAVVRFPKVEEYSEEVVYELNEDRNTDGTPTQMEVLDAGDYYPLDEEDPAELDAEYEPARETDNTEFVYAENPRLDVHTRKADPTGGVSTVPAYISVSEIELTPTGATVQLYNNLTEEVSLRNIRVIAGTAYYRNWSNIYEDNDTDATETEDLDGIYMPDKATAEDFIRRYRMEVNAEKTPIAFESSLFIAPNTLISIAEIPYDILIRTVTDKNDLSDVYEYEAVAYRVITVSVGTRIRVSGQGRAQDGKSPIPVRLYALGDADAPFDTGTRVADDTGGVADDTQTLGTGADWSLSRPTPGEGQYVWYVIGYYTPPSTWPTEWTTPVKDSGLNAYALQLSAPLGTTISMSGRGVLQTASLKFTAVLSNILPASVNWAISNGTLADVAGDDYSKTLDCSTVSLDSLTITITATIEGVTYSASIGVQRVWGTIVPENLGTVTALPTSVSGQPIASGDYFLVGTTFTEGATTYTKGEIWEYNGTAWILSTDKAKAMSLMADFADLEVDVASLVMANAVIKKLVAIDAMVKTLLAQNITAGPGDGTASSGFRFRAMSDEDLTGADNPVFDVMYDDQLLFKVDIATGKIYFGNSFWYDPADGKIHTPEDKTVIGSDGKLKAVDADLTGALSANIIEMNENAFVAGNVARYIADSITFDSGLDTSDKVTMTAICSGSARCKVTITKVTEDGSHYADLVFRVKKNGTTVHTTTITHGTLPSSPVTYTYDVSYVYGDVIEITIGMSLYNSGFNYFIEGLGLYFDTSFNTNDVFYFLQTEKVVIA